MNLDLYLILHGNDQQATEAMRRLIERNPAGIDRLLAAVAPKMDDETMDLSRPDRFDQQ